MSPLVIVGLIFWLLIMVAVLRFFAVSKPRK